MGKEKSLSSYSLLVITLTNIAYFLQILLFKINEEEKRNLLLLYMKKNKNKNEVRIKTKSKFKLEKCGAKEIST